MGVRGWRHNLESAMASIVGARAVAAVALAALGIASGCGGGGSTGQAPQGAETTSTVMPVAPDHHPTGDIPPVKGAALSTQGAVAASGRVRVRIVAPAQTVFGRTAVWQARQGSSWRAIGISGGHVGSEDVQPVYTAFPLPEDFASPAILEGVGDKSETFQIVKAPPDPGRYRLLKYLRLPGHETFVPVQVEVDVV